MNGFDKGNKNMYNVENEFVRLSDGQRDSDLLTMEEACNYLRIKKNTLYKLIYSCEIISFKIGRRRLVKKEDLDNFVNQKRAEAGFLGDISS